MDGINLLVTDQSAEIPGRINSLLRNSGINIHVIHVAKAAEVKTALDRDAPCLILHAQPDVAVCSLEEVSSLAHEYAVPLALYADLRQPEELVRQLQIAACIVIDAHSVTQLTETVARLVSEHRLLQAQARQRGHQDELKHRYDLLLDSARDAIAYIHEGLHVYANRAYLESLRVDSWNDMTSLSLLEILQSEGRDMKKILRGLSAGELPENDLPVLVRRLDGSTFEAHLNFSPARYNGEDCIQMLMHGRDAAAELSVELERVRITDPLTQLNNRRAFMDRLDQELAEPRSRDHVSAVLYLEPEGLADLQAELDAASIDNYIADIAGVLRTCLQPGDHAARISDYGFAVLSQQAGMEQLDELAGNILKTFHSHLVEIEDRSLSVSCSIGMAIVGRLAKSAAEIISGARKAQAEAAETGNCAVTYRPQLTAVTGLDDDRQWIERIRFALASNDFHMVRQPIVDLDGEGEQLMENTVFLKHGSGEYAPAQFAAIADRNELGGAIDREAIPLLLKSFAESSERQIITLSSNSIADFGFTGWLGDQLTAHCVEPARLIIQISAAAAQANLKAAQRLMQELHALGCKLSLCAFDDDRRSRQLLEHLDADFIKINSALTENLTGNSANQEAVRSIVDAAEAHGVVVIAEEVTDTSSLAILWQCGVKMIAGAFLKESSQVAAQ